MEGRFFTEPKSGDLVDSVLDIDEALHNYLINLNPQDTSLRNQMNNPTPYAYDLNPTTQPYTQFVSGADPGYFQVPTGAHQEDPETKINVFDITSRESTARTPYTSKRQNGDTISGVSSTNCAGGDGPPNAGGGVSGLLGKSIGKASQVQEKNRMAQKRFRERQKAKITELHMQIGELEQKVSQLVMENASLQSHNSLLEKVLAMRDEHIKIVQQQQALDAEQAEQEKEAGCRRMSITLTAIKGKEVRLNTDTLKKMTPDGVMQLWQMYVTEISSALVEANSHNGGSTKYIEELVEEVSNVFMRLCVVNPTLLKIWHTREYHMSETEELKKWQTLLSPLEMTDVQKNELCHLRTLLLDQLHGLVEERKALHSTIQTILVTETASHKLALEYLKTNQTVLRLREILRVENNAILQFVSTIIRKVLNPVQVATLYVHAYPSKPDLLAFTSAVALEQGEDITVAPETGSQEYRCLSDLLNPTSSIGGSGSGGNAGVVVGSSLESRRTTPLPNPAFLALPTSTQSRQSPDEG